MTANHNTMNGTATISTIFAFQGAISGEQATVFLGCLLSLASMIVTWYLSERAKIAASRREDERLEAEEKSRQADQRRKEELLDIQNQIMISQYKSQSLVADASHAAVPIPATVAP